MKTRSFARSQAAFTEAKKVIPGGVNSPVRAFGSVGGDPVFFERGKGSHVFDIDGNTYIDYVASWGPLILGHVPEKVVEAVERALSGGSSFGAPTERETALAEKIVRMVPSIEKVRMVNSGTEATMSAIRLARGYTGRSKVIKFIGCYHGHVDALLVQAGSGPMTLGTPGSPGIPESHIADTLALPYNDIDTVKEVFDNMAGDIAAVILEPIAGNMGVIPPKDGFLEGLRELTEKHDSILIFDEVITGFRIAPGGAQELYGVTPDMTTLGKVIGGGLPVGAYGGRADIMDHIAPDGPVYQAGTLSGNPLAMAAGLATLEAVSDESFHDTLEEKAARLAREFETAANAAGVPAFHARVGSMICTFFTDGEVVDFDGAKTCDTDRYAKFHHEMLVRGIYLAPSQFETMFISIVHTVEDIEQTASAVREVMKLL
ncbi:MAG: glutamate-1-semialdehyde-2,1-aminomutase [Planctomycetota bacterium]|nr:MAG: glutamate-1-semialdehyde-2,1-aminomutase [Planctomycetota bacterium]